MRFPRSSKAFVTTWQHLGMAVRCVVAVVSMTLALALADTEDRSSDSHRSPDRAEPAEYIPLAQLRQRYQFSSMQQSGGDIRLLRPGAVHFHLQLGNQQCFLNGIKFVLTHPICEVDGAAAISRVDLEKLIDPILRPQQIANAKAIRTVILDPGHGGHDSGAQSARGCEKNYTLHVAQLAQKLLTQAGYRVILTRSDDSFISLQRRVEIANEVKDSALFISVHFNCGNSDASGIETFTLSPQGVAHYGRSVKSSDFLNYAGNTHDCANVALATAIHGSVLGQLNQLKTIDRGIKRARYNVLSGVTHPAVLLEGGFLSHPTESLAIHETSYQQSLAQGILQAVNRYQRAIAPATRLVQRR